ncbi:MAG: PilZ domain-containing protein [Pseudomonadota bacterium]
MASESADIDRRRHKRYVMCDGTYAFLRPPANKIGQIIDISMSGLAFCYFSTNGASRDAQGLDLLVEEGLCLEDIPYTTVNDFILPNEQPFSQITMRRRCIKFGSLTIKHKEHLQQLIDRYGREA